MELDQKLAADEENFQTNNEQKKEKKDMSIKKIEGASQHLLTVATKVSQALENVSVDPARSLEISVKNDERKILQHEKEEQDLTLASEKVKEAKLLTEENQTTDETENKENSQEKELDTVNKADESSGSKGHLPSFPGTVTKSVPGSNDVKIEIDSNSLLDRVILYSLKNTVVDNSRLDAAKNKYMLNKGNITCNFSSSSNGSDSNSSSKSVEKLIEEFKGGCSKDSNDDSPSRSMDTTTTSVKQNSDNSVETANDSSTCGDTRNKSPLEVEKDETGVEINRLYVIAPSHTVEQLGSFEPKPNNVQDRPEIKQSEGIQQIESLPPKPNLENDALDFRDRDSLDAAFSRNNEISSPAMLDLSFPNRDEKNVPIIKRNHALYVGLPDFSKQIFTAPSISRSAVTTPLQQSLEYTGAPKVKNPDFSGMPRSAPGMQMKQPDFSKSFDKVETLSNQPSNIPITPSNFPDIVRKNNYISDLQLKPQSTGNGNLPIPTSTSSSPSSYKIDFRTSAVISQKLMQESKLEQPSTSQTIYPNVKKEGITAYNQQLIDEPMAHIIHKNQFLPHTSDQSRIGGWNDKNERLLGGASLSSPSTSIPQISERPNNHQYVIEGNSLPSCHLYPNSSEDQQKANFAYLPLVNSYKEQDFNNISQESQMSNEFSLKQKEQQLRQEGTIITIKNEPMREVGERRSADLFRDYKLKQPKESPDSARKVNDQHSGYQQKYPDFSSKFSKYNHQTKVETIVKPDHNSSAIPIAYHQEKQVNQIPTNSKSYHSPSPGSHHHQSKSPLPPPGSSRMNPPQHWPPPLVQQQFPRRLTSPSSEPAIISSQSLSREHPYRLSPSQSLHINYGYAFPIATPPGPSAVKVNPNYQSCKKVDPYSTQNIDMKEIPNCLYQPPGSSGSAQHYYHQNYPNFARHFEPDKKSPVDEQNVQYSQHFAQMVQRKQQPAADKTYQRIPSHHEFEIRAVRDRENQVQYPKETGPNHHQNKHVREIVHEYPPPIQEPQSCRQEMPLRMIDDRSKVHHLSTFKVEKRMDEPSNLLLQRSQPSNVSVIAKVKIEPAVTPRNIPSTSTIIKSKSIFAEVKRESPLDLSVKTVKTKADSTGCDQDIQTLQSPEQGGLKIEFAPNFNNTGKADSRNQARQVLQDKAFEKTPLNASEKPSTFQKYIGEVQNSRTPPDPTTPPFHHHKQSQYEIPHNASSNRNFSHEHRFHHTKGVDRPNTLVPSLPNSSQYSERPSYPIEIKPYNASELQRSEPTVIESRYSRKDFSRFDEKPAVNSKRDNPYYLPPQTKPQTPSESVPYPTSTRVTAYHSSSSTDAARTCNNIQGHIPSYKDPLQHEREKDRKYVEDILYGRKRNEATNHLDTRHFQSIVSPPRKRIIEQQHVSNYVPNKQVQIEEPSGSIQEPRRHLQPSDQPAHFRQLDQQTLRRVENQDMIGQPPALVKTDLYKKPFTQSFDLKCYPDMQFDKRKDENIQQVILKNHSQYQNSQYYPNPKAEMIHRSDPSNSYKHERLEYSNQNFQQRPDDNTLQLYSRIHHPILQESGIRIEHQQAGQGLSSGETVRLINGTVPPSISGSNGNIARGADQSTILKLKTNLELKEQKKLIIHKSELGDDLDQTKKDLSPRQFRTKGELKGFIPLPILDDKKNSAALPTLPSSFDLLDWGSACNDFVQQLETGKKYLKMKRSVNSKLNTDGETEEKQATGIHDETIVNDSLEISKENIYSMEVDVKFSSSDEDKPLLELVNSQNSGEVFSVVGKKFEKNVRNLREKQRLELEQKHAARLGPSSSESETDVRRPVRTAIRVRRLRKRAALGIKKTDEEPSIEEEETEEEIIHKVHKRHTTRSISKMDDLTSSEDEKKKSQTKDKNHINERKITKTASKVITKHDLKKHESSSESCDSDDTTPNKSSKLSSAKNTKKLKKLGDGSNIINMLEEEKTMTRSKRKLEIEKTLSNSKILRNEKIVQNVSPDKKAKAEAATKKIMHKRKNSTTKLEDTKRKVDESDSDENVCKIKKRPRRVLKIGNSSPSHSEDSQAEESKTERLRPRKTKPETDPSPKVSREMQKKKFEDKLEQSKILQNEVVEMNAKPTLQCRIPFTGMFPFKDDEKTSKFTPGWEADTYSYKRSLKIPAGLITIGRPPQHGISHSLPDLDPQTSDTSEIFSEFVKSKDKDGSKSFVSKGKTESSNILELNTPAPKKACSIIDLLHQRVVQSRKKFKAKKVSNYVGLSTQAEDDLLPTPEKESEKVFGFKVNIFETSIITSRTRTENNALRKKEILKEVFGAEDERPKSAPPVGAPIAEEDDSQKELLEANEKISYDQKYREYLEKMNVDFLPKTSDTSKKNDCRTADTSLKDEEDDDEDNETVIASERDLVTPTMKGKLKKGRGRRCKGSSGFDYIRKKKKPTANGNENPLSVNNIIKKRLAAMENLENKDETDISKEMKGWVLNKGVGESVLHKASRLDYVDVIAFCLERMNMSPDQKDNAGYTPLHEACSRGHLEIARILLQYGANHSETALSGIRPLHEAIENGHVEIVRLLISFGADPCLATYSGQLPISMAEDKEMEDFLSEYLVDIEHKKGNPTSWYFNGPFKQEDPSEEGYEVFKDIPINKTDLVGSSVASIFSTSLTSLVTATTQMSDNETVAGETTATPIKVPATSMKVPSQDLIKYQHKMKKYDTNSNNLLMSDANSQDNSKVNTPGKKAKGCGIVLNPIDSSMKKIKKLPAIPKQEHITPIKLPESIQTFENLKHKEDYDDIVNGENLESDSEFLEIEESEAPLPPLYLLKDEGSEKWILLTDLCNLLKVKSKDAVLKQICPSSPPALNKELIRELKMSEFLEKAVCLQLFCAGEKLNVRASKVSLVRYNDSVRNLLGVQTIRMNM